MKETRDFIDSSHIDKMEYDTDTKILKVWFLNGSVYEYSGVPEYRWEEAKNADSIGSYHYTSIRRKYPYEQIK